MPQTAPLSTLMAEMAELIAAACDDVDQVTANLNLNPSGLSVDIYPAPTFRRQDDAGFGALDGGYVFTVRARLDIGDLDGSQAVLLDLMDDANDQSVALALTDDQTLGGYATSVYVEGPTGFQPYTDSVQGGTTVGVEWTVTVLRALS